ncbi:hypothetical protein VU12_12320, partial [Desulfobulbus sp. US4]|nr:hypothetical protein [Desulfobulbus sp. US4]
KKQLFSRQRTAVIGGDQNERNARKSALKDLKKEGGGKFGVNGANLTHSFSLNHPETVVLFGHFPRPFHAVNLMENYRGALLVLISHPDCCKRS